MIREAIAKLIERQDLLELEASRCMEEIMEGMATPAQIASFLTALRMKGETVEELTGLLRVMRARVTPLAIEETVIDTCGTGGDGKNTFNISTAVAFVVAGTGLKVAKHGNKSSTSLSGSADVLRLLGVNVEASPATVIHCIKEAGIGFLFAPLFHKSMRFVAAPRRELGIKTAFNLLGPLANPVPKSRQLIGVFSHTLTESLAKVLSNLGTERAMVVSGLDGLDELTTTESTKITELNHGNIKTSYILPEDVGITRASLQELEIKSIEESAYVIRNLLEGKATRSQRDIVLLNSAAAIIVGGCAKDLKEGLFLATESLNSGKARRSLERLVEVSQKGGE